MQAISHLIFNLLSERRRVILPGLGTLYTESVPAAIGPDGVLTVPQTRVLFTAVEESGETLPEIIAAHSGLPLKEIRPQYNRWLDNLRRASSDGELAIDGTVLLLRQPDGSYWAEPARELDRLLNPSEQKTFRLPVVAPSKEKSKKTSAKKSPASPVAGKTDSRGKRRAMWLAVGGAVLSVLIYAGYFAWTRGAFDPKISVPAPVSQPFEPPRQEQPVAAVEEPGTFPADSAAAEVPAVVEPAVSAVPGTGILPENHTGDVYHIIAGVFSTRENAERFVRDSGFEAARTTIISTAGGRFMVSVGRFPDKLSADAEVGRLHDLFPEAWVSKRRS